VDGSAEVRQEHTGFARHFRSRRKIAMIRTISAVSCLLLCAAATTASADMTRKAGEWQITGNSSSMGTMSQKVCLSKDEPAVDLKGPQGCAQPTVVNGANSVTIDTACSDPRGGGKMTVHAVITQTGPDSFRNETHMHMEGGPQGMPPDSTTTVEAKRLGPCQPGDQPEQ
jgi:hypothetical protein